jgi:hypothetical protein
MREQPTKNDENPLPYNRNAYKKNATYYIIWKEGNLNPTLAARLEFRGDGIEK